MTPSEEKKQLRLWKATLLGIWEDAVKVGNRRGDIKDMRDAFEAGFNEGRRSVKTIPFPRKQRSEK